MKQIYYPRLKEFYKYIKYSIYINYNLYMRKEIELSLKNFQLF